MANPMLVLSIWNSQKGNDEHDTKLVHSVAHAWYEGHLHAHVEAGQKVEIMPRSDDDFPPPFPARDDPRMWEIVTLTENNDFRSQEAALAFAAALAWEAGYRRGNDCPGCQAFGTPDPAYAARVRRGRVKITIGGEPPASKPS